MVSMESIQQRLDNPKAYYVFYEYFYKGAVDKSAWTESMEVEGKRLGNNNTEGFALLMLANNYMAWLYEEKKDKPNLMTEYDTGPASGHENVVDVLQRDLEYVLHDEDDALVVRSEENREYIKAKNKRRRFLEKLLDTEESKNHCEKLKEVAEKDIELDTDSDKERVRKKRKLLRDLRKFTGPPSKGERRFRGWSDAGQKQYEAWADAIGLDVEAGRYKKWEKAYKQVVADLELAARGEGGGDDEPRVEKHEPNREKLWELD
jgi:hypothetical protein